MCAVFSPLCWHTLGRGACVAAGATVAAACENGRREITSRRFEAPRPFQCSSPGAVHCYCRCDASTPAAQKDSFHISRGDIILRRSIDIRQEYTIESELGTGGFGTVSLGTHKRTGKQYAIKRIPKESTSHYEFQIEVNTLADLDHPHIVKLVEHFEGDDNYYLVTELCKGPDLVDFLREQGCTPVSEKEVSIVMRQCLKSVLGCHASGFIHRDIKLDNFMITGEDRTVKMIDFGLATRYSQGQKMTRKVGTLDYWPPEVVVGTSNGYNTLVDEWSLGVVMYALLSGELLLPASEGVEVGEKCEVMDKGIWLPATVIAKNLDNTYAVDVGGTRKMWLGHVKSELIRPDQQAQAAMLFSDPDYVKKRLESSTALSKRHTSSAARELLGKMLNQDPGNRISAAEALDDPFISKYSHDALSGSTVYFTPGLDTHFIEKMRTFSQAPLLKKVAQLIMTHLVSENDSRRELFLMRHMFRTVDLNGDGAVSLEELSRYLKEQGVQIPSDLATVYRACDAYGNGTINFCEFSAAIFPVGIIDRKLCNETFRLLDRETNLAIGAKDLVALFKSQRHTLSECQDIIDEAERAIRGPDDAMNGTLDLDDFYCFMCSSNMQNQ